MVGIIADLHDHMVNFRSFLKKAYDFDLEELWIAGDLGTSETCAEVLDLFPGTIRLVAGNVEEGHGFEKYEDLAKKTSRLFFDRHVLNWETQNYRILLTHNIRQPLTAQYKPNLIIYGHSHKPDIINEKNVWKLNPGTLGGIYLPATFVLGDLKKFYFRLEKLY